MNFFNLLFYLNQKFVIGVCKFSDLLLSGYCLFQGENDVSGKTKLDFFGIEIDTVAMNIMISDDKLANLTVHFVKKHI